MRVRYFDAHTHVQFAAYDKDRDEVILRAGSLGVGIVNIGTEKITSKAAVQLAHVRENMYAVVGVHPTHASGSMYRDPQELRERPLSNSSELAGGVESFDYEYYKKLA